MESEKSHRREIGLLLFGSGFAALIYQIVWLREFRLIFGASTAASAAVLGIFMGGLGLGSAWLGQRSELTRRPLLFYGRLEILIALSAASTPALLWLVKLAYIRTGGSVVLGQEFATLLRLFLSALVLAIPTVLMGGTLPAAARAALTERDTGRRGIALLYGCNALGAVAGAALSTFWLVEYFGNRQTLWIACALNVGVALVACALGRRFNEVPREEQSAAAGRTAIAAPSWIMVAAALVGFAFMLMELVWYRMLSPILGGSTYTFGLILVIALLGIGIGGAAYSVFAADRRPTIRAFAFTCAFEAAVLALPFALGDQIAMLALNLRSLGTMGFVWLVLGWSLVAGLLVLPAAIVAGYQFPMLIALLGRGRAQVGRQAGLAYAANTLGAIVGSIAGGFLLVPWLSAPGAWKLVVVVLSMLAMSALVLSFKNKEGAPSGAIAAAFAALLMMFMAEGPSAAWRHSGIGVSRADAPKPVGENAYRNFVHYFQRITDWESEGIESSVALAASSGYAFVVNGKADGHTRADAGTQVMGSMLGAVLHPAPRRALVIGLGTGTSAGWLADLPTMERVDVVELEPVIVEVARRSALVNRNVLANPKIRMHFGDAREVLLTTKERYDIIASEPSNPYRAGIASLFTREFYAAAANRLASGGLFLQWVQAYSIDNHAIGTIYTTLNAVFPSVETWTTEPVDLLMVASRNPLVIDARAVRERLAEEPLSSAVRHAWRVNTLEGVLSHYAANEEFSKLFATAGHPMATDDDNALEFGFARTLGNDQAVARELLALAQRRHLGRPAIVGDVDWDAVAANFPSHLAIHDAAPEPWENEPELLREHRIFAGLWQQRSVEEAARHWREKKLQPLNLAELSLAANVFANLGAREEAEPYIQKLSAFYRGEASAILARLRAKEGNWIQTGAELEHAFTAWRTDPWTLMFVVKDAIQLAVSAGENGGPALAQKLFRSLEKPFPLREQDEARRAALFSLARIISRQPAPDAGLQEMTIALDSYGSALPWSRAVLLARLQNLKTRGDARMDEAALDYRRFVLAEPQRLDSGMSLEKVQAAAQAQTAKLSTP